MTTTLLHLAFDLAFLPMVAVVLVGHLGRFDWLFEMTNFFRPHLAVLAVLMVVLAIVSQGGWPRLAASVVLVAAAAWPLIVPAVPSAKAAETRSLRLLTANVLFNNDDHDRLIAMVRAADPDVITLEEARGSWHEALKALAKDYPYTSDASLDSTVVVLSRYPLKSVRVPLRPEAEPKRAVGGAPPLRSEITLPGALHPIVIYSVHAPTTRRAQGWLARNAYLDDVATAVASEAEGRHVIVAGDWNTPYWSPTLRRFLGATGLVTTERGAWPPPTRFFREWHAPVFLGTPIDRVVVSPGVGLAAIKTGAEFGSDHLPVTVDLALD